MSTTLLTPTATLPRPTAPPAPVPPSRPVLDGVQPATDLDDSTARRYFPDASAAMTAKTLSPFAPKFDAMHDAIEATLLAFVGQDPVKRAAQIEQARAEVLRTIPRDRPVSAAELDQLAAARVDAEWRDTQVSLVRAVTGTLQTTIDTLAADIQQAEQQRREPRPDYEPVATALSEDEQRALDPSSIMFATDKLTARHLLETRGMRADLQALRAEIAEMTAATELPLSTPPDLLVRYAASGTSAALQKRAEFALGLLLDGTVPAPAGTDLRALRTRVEEIRSARVPPSVRAAEQAERVHLDELTKQAARLIGVLQANVSGSFQRDGSPFSNTEQLQREADARARARVATSRAWAPVLVRARQAKAR